MPTNDYTGGTVPLSRWQVKLAQRVAGLEPGCYTLVLNVPAAGTVEPWWCFTGQGKVENGR